MAKKSLAQQLQHCVPAAANMKLRVMCHHCSGHDKDSNVYHPEDTVLLGCWLYDKRIKFNRLDGALSPEGFKAKVESAYENASRYGFVVFSIRKVYPEDPVLLDCWLKNKQIQLDRPVGRLRMEDFQPEERDLGRILTDDSMNRERCLWSDKN